MNPSRDALFTRFVFGLFLILILYGAGMAVVVLWGDEKLAAKMLTGFTTMFAAVIGLGTGYLLGSSGNGKK